MAQRSQTRGFSKPPLPSLPSRPEDLEAPDLPANLAEVSDIVLMNFYNRFISWAGYAGGELATAIIDERKAERQLSRTETFFSVQYKTEKTVAATKARVQQEPEYQEAEDAVDYAFARKKVLETLYNHYEKCAAACSRELSRRLARRDVENRNDKYNT